jgi:hypothetical protein
VTEFVCNFDQLRTTDAVNRLALSSLIFDGGAVLTGFFGMNFGREFTRVVFEGEGSISWLHYLLVFIVTTFVLGSLLLRTIVVLRSWREYFAILNPPQSRGPATSIKRERQPASVARVAPAACLWAALSRFSAAEPPRRRER